jgi:hypothetical protein
MLRRPAFTSNRFVAIVLALRAADGHPLRSNRRSTESAMIAIIQLAVQNFRSAVTWL